MESQQLIPPIPSKSDTIESVLTNESQSTTATCQKSLLEQTICGPVDLILTPPRKKLVFGLNLHKNIVRTNQMATT